ncbi:enoyl-CoA hydratase/isomerase family protein [Natronolimnobius sp. AArcel1]|uniref:enoyl-CoA hydratase/isomerase family protein n=1 Tax=Natronolimnobius sp. AArcel1 TaxID=1679093 RepID=UPI0013EA947C|nr:enoyl-CoA hydratase/isomerase family protein [Natronolimnobius sp. AArcel1]NGM70496.1 enoyl-CoA hydratase/isomerase family protein [Natronolimnobius sp. AArcel1]
MEPDHLLLERAPPIQRITLNRPDRLNALATQTWAELRDALRDADEDDEVRVIILGGEGRAFCSGDDIADFEFETTADARAYARHIMSCGLTIERIETPVISSVHGLAHGGGCEIAALADVTIASEEATFRLPEALVGAVPGIGLVRFPELIGLKQTRELMLTGREFDATEAHDLGLVNEVAPADELEDVVTERAEDVARTAPVSAQLIKRILNSRLEDEAEAVNALTLIFTMDDAVEGMEAFFDGREPEWSGN